MSVYANHVNKHAATAKSANNKKKVAKLTLLAKDKAVVAMLKENNVDASRLSTRALYAAEKVVKIVYAVTRDTVDVTALNKNAFAAIKTAILAQKNDMTLTKRDIECSLSKDQVTAKDREKIIYRRSSILSANTLQAQSQQCVDMLKTLELVEETAKNVFRIKDTAIMKAFTEKFANIAA